MTGPVLRRTMAHPFAPTPVLLRKICEAPGARFPAVAWIGFAVGSRGRDDESLPIAYEIEGELTHPLVLGQPMRILRSVRNGIDSDGEFVSSPVQEIGMDWVRTENSVYHVQLLSLR